MTDLELRVILIEAKDLLFKSRDTDERGLRRYRCPLGAAKICALLFGPVERSEQQIPRFALDDKLISAAPLLATSVRLTRRWRGIGNGGNALLRALFAGHSFHGIA